jgi:hypothetical protein
MLEIDIEVFDRCIRFLTEDAGSTVEGCEEVHKGLQAV